MLGIDVSKNKLDGSLTNGLSFKRLWHETVGNDTEGIEKLLARTDPDIPWVVEPTGRYSNLVVRQATQAGRKVLLAPTKSAKLFLKSTSPRVKSDKVDSFGLALFGLSRQLAEFNVKSEAVDNLDQLLTARKGFADSLQRATLQRSELPYAQGGLDKLIKILRELIKDSDKQIRLIAESDIQFVLIKSLQTVPGIGPVIAASIASRLIGRTFDRPDAFVAYVGLDVAVRQSGKSVGRVKLTKQGDAELRRLLYMAAMANLSCKSSVFKDQYYSLRQQGRSHTATLNIIARKIAHICWALHKHGGTFDPTKVYRSLPSAAQPKDTPQE